MLTELETVFYVSDTVRPPPSDRLIQAPDTPGQDTASMPECAAIGPQRVGRPVDEGSNFGADPGASRVGHPAHRTAHCRRAEPSPDAPAAPAVRNQALPPVFSELKPSFVARLGIALTAAAS